VTPFTSIVSKVTGFSWVAIIARRSIWNTEISAAKPHAAQIQYRQIAKFYVPNMDIVEMNMDGVLE